MGSWKQQIEAQIADLRRYSYESDDPTDEIRQLIDSMHNAATQLEALLDVAVAAEKMTDRNAKADSSGDLHEIKVLQAEIERLREELNVTRLQRDARLSSQTAVDEAAAREIERLESRLRDRQNALDHAIDYGHRMDDKIERLSDEIERLRELTENDGKEIGSYREGTGLRGENQRLRDALEECAIADTAEAANRIAREALNAAP